MIFGNLENTPIMEGELRNSLVECYILEEMSTFPKENIDSFLESDEARALEEAGIISRRTLVRLSKQDDLTRRVKIAALDNARSSGDALWKQLKKNRKKERELIAKIVKKYGNKARKDAKVAQKAYLKNRPSILKASNITRS